MSRGQPFVGNWTHLLTTDRLKRSSHVLTAIGDTLCIFGGEVTPRKPVDDDVDVLALPSDSCRHETQSASPAPRPRVGSAAALLGDRMYVYSGRGGADMSPLEEDGCVWNFDPETMTWYEIQPLSKSQPYAQPRSYHCMTSDGQTSLYIHAGCPAKDRLSDLWKFDLFSRSWLQLPDAPGPARGGASIACHSGKLYRMNGFDGTTEQGGSLDIFDIDKNTWSTRSWKPNGQEGPEPRSVCALLPLAINGKDILVTMFGERDPSMQGHAGAGKMLDDVWVFDIATAKWARLDIFEGKGRPKPRGWFAADVLKRPGKQDAIVIHGGLNEDNERLGDVWKLDFEANDAT
ncbi:kelch repeat protein-like protein [Sporormia fimetaria CBS 119925]|uniref:Kelch repeat protein-like protein n=1 Tax=Sporormia fimetaria CBS 119925 TaxID=1340428 RepID=A0A6A6VKV1_9PLEO|nr:kelch repeat protein-like protein [Sporormia fimetaria CBS 119925]